ncbi:hypothetical protein D3C86_2153980 [compost metagenome]
MQEDAFFLGIPTVVHRKVTERQDGIGFNAELSGLDIKKVALFLKDHKNKKDLKRTIESASPSQIIVDTFLRDGYFSNK